MRRWSDLYPFDPRSHPMMGYRARRAVLFLAILFLHLLLVLRLASRISLVPGERPVSLSVFTVSSISERSASARPKLRRVLRTAAPVSAPIVRARSSEANGLLIPAAPTSSGPSIPAGGCALAQSVGQAIEEDAQAMTEIDSLPPASRTAADAILLWNGQWLGSGEVPAGSATDSLRRVVEQVVAAAPAECRNAKAAGPQFIPVVVRDRTMMVVVGSGTWRWADLIASPDDCHATGCQSDFEDAPYKRDHQII